MGIFCSAVTRNQIIAAVLCFAGMMAHLGIYLVRGRVARFQGLQELFTFISFIDLWINSLDGLVAPRFLFFHVSLAIFFLFLTLKVLEARKWR
jgi:ABC-2 type transport system permease protein